MFLSRYVAVIAFVFLSGLSVYAFEMDSNTVIVMRMPTYSAKIKYLNNQIQINQNTPSQRTKFEKIKNNVENQRDAYFNLITALFIVDYTATPIYFVPDTSYKSFLTGDLRCLISISGEAVSVDLKGKTVFYMVQGRDEYQLLLTTRDNMPPPYPWPYKKNTFLAVMHSIINKKSYMTKQVKWFDKEMRKAILLTNLE